MDKVNYPTIRREAPDAIARPGQPPSALARPALGSGVIGTLLDPFASARDTVANRRLVSGIRIGETEILGQGYLETLSFTVRSAVEEHKEAIEMHRAETKSRNEALIVNSYADRSATRQSAWERRDLDAVLATQAGIRNVEEAGRAAGLSQADVDAAVARRRAIGDMNIESLAMRTIETTRNDDERFAAIFGSARRPDEGKR